MVKTTYGPFWVIVLMICLSPLPGLLSCASTGSPTGGPRDITPPRLDTARSSRNGQVFFKPRLLTFHFDEFVEVKEPVKQVLVSPPLTYIPRITHRGKKVTFQFDEKEVLKDNATYTINFGEAIVDYHEGNVLSPFSFVFGTGGQLDSLTLEGKVISARTGEIEKDMVVFLYDEVEDSIVKKEKPLYFARPDKEGVFQFLNIKADTFRLLAIKDENLNYRYDLPTEKVAFPDSLIMLSDTFRRSLTLLSSLPDPPRKVLTVNAKTYGKVNLLYNTRPPEELSVSASDPAMTLAYDAVLDSLNVYYDTSLDSFFVYVGKDTFLIKPRGKTDFLKKQRFTIRSTSPLSGIPARDSVEIEYNVPVGDLFSPAKVILMDSSGRIEGARIELAQNRRSIRLFHKWTPGHKYSLQIPKQSFQSIYGAWNDSLRFDISILPAEKTAGLRVDIEGLDTTSTYLVRVLREQTPVGRAVIQGKQQHALTFTGLAPDKYTIEVVQDIIPNRRWDPGDFWLKRQPEPYYLFKGDKLRENWDSEMKINLKAGTARPDEPKVPSGGLPLSNPLEKRKK